MNACVDGRTGEEQEFEGEGEWKWDHGVSLSCCGIPSGGLDPIWEGKHKEPESK